MSRTIGELVGKQVRNPDDNWRFDQHRQLMAGMVGELATLRTTLDKYLAKGLLWDGTVQLDANGGAQMTFARAAQGIYIINNTAALLTAVAGSRGASAPTTGAGVHQIPSTGGTGVRINSRGATTWTFYGSPNTFFSCQFFDAVIVD
jgi:hypothetical protein